MKTPALIAAFRMLSCLVFSLALGACAQLVNLRTVRPTPPVLVSADENLRRAMTAIAEGKQAEKREPLAAIADYLSAVESASLRLSKQPQDSEAQQVYNFALARVLSVIHDHKIPPWTQPLEVKSTRGTYRMLPMHDALHRWDPANYDLIPVDSFQVGGTGFKKAIRTEGLGAAVVASLKKSMVGDEKKFQMSGKLFYSDTAVARFVGQNCDISLLDPLITSTVSLNGHTFPLAADYRTSTAMLLHTEKVGRVALKRVFHPGKFDDTARIMRLQPYDPNKIPVLFIHGLQSSPETWVEMFGTLRADPEIRRNYQFWFFSWPTGYPYFHPAAVLRRELDEVKKAYPNNKQMVVVGHSMGAMITRLMLTDSGDDIWKVYFKTPPAQTPLQPEDRQFMEDCMIFKHRSEISRSVFICGPQRGVDMATGWIGRIGDSLVRLPGNLATISKRISPLIVENPDHIHTWSMPSSIDTLTPRSRFVKAVNKLPLTPGIPFHQIMGDRGRGDTPNSSDGLVPYSSSHLDGAQSELIVPSGHNAQQNPQAIEEVRRILKLHLHENGASGTK
ncbi:hypothetical protein BH11VER1_BH11VER1_34020 [soil metagenome]